MPSSAHGRKRTGVKSDHRRDAGREHCGQQLVRRRPLVGSTKALGLVGDDRMATVDVDLVAKSTIYRPSSRGHSHSLMVGDAADSVIRERPRGARGTTATEGEAAAPSRERASYSSLAAALVDATIGPVSRTGG